MPFPSFFNTYWSTAEALITIVTINLTAYIFFSDPIRRWKFLGYRPTLILSIFDPKTKKILLIKSKRFWCLPQGGIYGSDVYTTVEQTIQRELGLSSENYKLEYVKPVGHLKKDKQLQRATIGTITIYPHLRGKGYLACFIKTDLNKLMKNIKLGYGISKTQTVTIKQATSILSRPKNHPNSDKAFSSNLVGFVHPRS